MKVFLMIIGVWMWSNATAQEVKISMDSDVESQIAAYNKSQKAIATIPVYRIQFGVTSDRRVMETELANFKREFNLKVDWFQKGPYYYLTAGAYRTKLEGYPDMKVINERFGSAIYLVENVKKQYVLE
ncbi:MAG: hypothetical protein KDC25_06435 [Saprospiraceae bacterium]|jgi:hypothetical protein|nr:hypothetical protein [Saprospiraceae bacterium]